MSKTIAINTEYDIVLDGAGNVDILGGKPAIAQNTRTAMAAQRGEQVFDTDAGMPMAATAFGGLRKAAFDANARQVISEVTGVQSVEEFESARVGDAVEYTTTIQTGDGPVVVGTTGLAAGGFPETPALPTACPVPSGSGGNGRPGPPGPPGPPGTGTVIGPYLHVLQTTTQDETIPSNQNALGINTTIAVGTTTTVEAGATLIIIGNMQP